MKKNILILTKSYKHGGWCIAGIIRNQSGNYQWVRLVSNESGDQISKNDFPFETLDIIEADIYECPQKPNHTENCTYANPQKISSINTEQLKDIFNKMPHSFFGSMSSTADGFFGKSLTFFLAKNIHVYQKMSPYDGKYRPKMDFEMGKNIAKAISVTDPAYYTKEVHIPLAICVASIPNDGPIYNKFIASIFPINAYESMY